ncbi:MAG: hypothetical protein JST04_15750 [Bdellovibrionales bacterium]|nr:hypothetical protein [Bdellovibrionales bacterium]
MRADLLFIPLIAGFTIAAGFSPSLARAEDPAPIPRTKKQDTFSRKLQKEFCTRLFKKDWTSAAAAIQEPVEVNGFKFGMGTKMKVRVDDEREAEGLLLGRLVSDEDQTVGFLFQDPAGKKNYIIPPSRCSLKFAGRNVDLADIQAIRTTMMQEGENCAELATVNYFAQLVLAGHLGNGTLKEELEHPAGWLKLIQHANEYYTSGRGAGNFKPIFKELGEKYGFVCHSLEVVSPAYLEKTVMGLLRAGKPALIEFYIGSDMKNARNQWVNTTERVGEDRRMWLPRAIGEKNGGGHALVAIGAFANSKGKEMLLVNDSDWEARPVEWDAEEYFSTRVKSSGMMAHYCE